jgi:hypothetical protein
MLFNDIVEKKLETSVSLKIFHSMKKWKPITVAARSKA